MKRYYLIGGDDNPGLVKNKKGDLCFYRDLEPLLKACKYALKELGPGSNGDNCWQAYTELKNAVAKISRRQK